MGSRCAGGGVQAQWGPSPTPPGRSGSVQGARLSLQVVKSVRSNASFFLLFTVLHSQYIFPQTATLGLTAVLDNVHFRLQET